MINVYAHSDFGRAFQLFHRDFLAVINKRTTVIILGDARNNYNLPHEWVLRDMQPAGEAGHLAEPGKSADLGIRGQ